eukprot:8654007-Karenia_brevis.AAC.1
MDLRASLNKESDAYAKLLPRAVEKYERENPDGKFKDLEEDRQLRLVNELQAEEDKSHFPFNDNMFSIMFIIMSDLNDQQRLNLINQLEMRGVYLKDFTWAN